MIKHGVCHGFLHANKTYKNRNGGPASFALAVVGATHPGQKASHFARLTGKPLTNQVWTGRLYRVFHIKKQE
jgi:hypothetical protein